MARGSGMLGEGSVATPQGQHLHESTPDTLEPGSSAMVAYHDCHALTLAGCQKIVRVASRTQALAAMSYSLNETLGFWLRPCARGI